MRRRWAAGLIAGLCLVAGSATAQTVDVSLSATTNAPSIGRVVRGGSSTVFSYPAGAMTPTKTGPAIHLAPGLTGMPTVSIGCGFTGSNSGGCNNRRIEVKITATAGDSAVISQFRVGTLACPTVCSPAYVGGTPAPGASMTFLISGVGKEETATFPLGMDVTVASSGLTGLRTFAYKVEARSVP